jgi:hypothetical protein
MQFFYLNIRGRRPHKFEVLLYAAEILWFLLIAFLPPPSTHKAASHGSSSGGASARRIHCRVGQRGKWLNGGVGERGEEERVL